MRYQFKGDKHVHLLDGRPLYGTTTVINDVYPPPLAWYGSGKALEPLGFITEKKEPDIEKRLELAAKGQDEVRLAADMNLEDYMAWLEKCYRNHDAYKKSQGKKGTDAHALIENYIKICLDQREGKPLNPDEVTFEGIEAFTKWAYKDVDKFLWSEAHTFSEKLWVGGITDFGFIHKTGKVIIGDAKPAVYPKYFIQTAAYGIQIKESGLFHDTGVPLEGNKPVWSEKIEGYCIFDYNKGIPWYLSAVFVPKLEEAFVHTVEMYKMKDLIGTNTLK